jgi:hypothetical protein
MTKDISNASNQNEADDMSIEKLGLSDDAIHVLTRFHVQSVEDCLFLLRRLEEQMPMGLPPPILLSTIDTEVRSKLENLGYWPQDNREST